MFVRNRAALFFSLVVPLLIMLIFGVLNFGGTTEVSLGLVDQANNQASRTLRAALDKTEAFDVQVGEQQSEVDELGEGHRDLVLVIPAGFALQPTADAGRQLTAYTNVAKPQQAQVGGLLLNAVVSQVMLAAGQPGGPAGPVVQVKPLPGRDLGYIDFLVPGMLALTVMQLGLFSVSFGFVQLKRTGALRRLFATPTSPAYFLGAQVTEPSAHRPGAGAHPVRRWPLVRAAAGGVSAPCCWPSRSWDRASSWRWASRWPAGPRTRIRPRRWRTC